MIVFEDYIQSQWSNLSMLAQVEQKSLNWWLFLEDNLDPHSLSRFEAHKKQQTQCSFQWCIMWWSHRGSIQLDGCLFLKSMTFYAERSVWWLFGWKNRKEL